MKTLFWLICIAIGANQLIVLAERGFGGTSQCCKAMNSDGNNDFDDKMMSFTKECRMEMNIGDDQKLVHGQQFCISECIGKKLNVINSDGSLAEDEYRNFLNTELGGEEYKRNVAEAIITKCIEEAKAPSNMPNKINGCNTTPLKAGICISREFFKACPIEMQDTSEECVEFRKMIESGRGAPPA